MTNHTDLPLADLATRLRQDPMRKSPFENRHATTLQDHKSDYTARPMPSPAGPRNAPVQPGAKNDSSDTECA